MEFGAYVKNCSFSDIEVKSGTGCAQAIIVGKLTGSESICGYADENDGCC